MLTKQTIQPLLEKHGGKIIPPEAIDTLVISKITCDPAKVQPRTTFFCVPGETRGRQYPIRDAIDSGANSLICEEFQADVRIPQIIVASAREAFAEFSAALYDYPSRKLRMIGVTGTNGKTTTTHLIDFIFRYAQRRCGVIGTLGYKGPDDLELQYFDHTTPPAAELEEMLAEMSANTCRHVALEVTSHGLVFRRVGGIQFAVAVLTNITQEHLDFHKTMEHYWQSKRLLFESLNDSPQESKLALINLDDPLATEFLAVCGPSLKTLTYGFSPSADIHVLAWEWKEQRSYVSLNTPTGKLNFSMQLPGRFNVYNAMAAAAVCLHEGIEPELIAKAFDKFEGVPGRFEVVSRDFANAPLCIVDFAHTPDALQNVLSTIRDFQPKDGKIICVFGCAGERDQTKRRVMGTIAEKLSDKIIITSDNPGNESIQVIIEQILSGIKALDTVTVELDRSKAIRLALAEARSNDIVLLAGKGHEHYQLIGDAQLPFSDRAQARTILAELFL